MSLTELLKMKDTVLFLKITQLIQNFSIPSEMIFEA
jgi:hypothetical protein